MANIQVEGTAFNMAIVPDVVNMFFVINIS
jgi:hypothetical protein